MPRFPRSAHLHLRRRLMVGAIAVTILALASGASAFDFTTIDVPGAVATLPAGINRAGNIVGLYTDAAGNAHGFLAVP